MSKGNDKLITWLLYTRHTYRTVVKEGIVDVQRIN